MELNKKLILVDCDGVLVDWLYSFDSWMQDQGHKTVDREAYDIGERYGIEYGRSKALVARFNESANIGWMSPFKDSIKYVKKLHEHHGYVFHCITSLSLNPYAIKLREQNIRNLFGETAFEKIICLDTGADKTVALSAYKDTECFWIEDKDTNCDVGISFGLRGILLAHDHNASYQGPGIRVSDWAKIYDIIIG